MKSSKLIDIMKKRKDDYKYEYDFKNNKSLQIVQRADSRK
jgi:hypothetical protein